MKLAIAALLLLLTALKTNEIKESISLPGAYKMLSVSFKSAKTDTTDTNPNQFKIYTKDYMMYANINSPDSISSFGIGSYSLDNGIVTENVIYSASDSMSNANPESFKLKIEKTKKGYRQFITGMKDNAGQPFDLTEEYESVGTGASSALDGAWKQVERYEVNGTDTTASNPIQYKSYFSGYCIWGNTWKDSLNKAHTGIGFGKFTMQGDNKVKESMIASTYYQVRGQDFDIDITMMGQNGFKQTMNNPDGSKTIEVYERLTK